MCWLNTHAAQNLYAVYFVVVDCVRQELASLTCQLMTYYL
jgi:hypothetical protein